MLALVFAIADGNIRFVAEPNLEFTEAFLAKIAGWEAMKRARALWDQGAVGESHWNPPRLEGAVRDGATTYRAGLIINGPVDVHNLCACRDSRGRGLVCAHSVAVGLHCLKGSPPPALSHSRLDADAKRASSIKTPAAAPSKPPGRRMRRAAGATDSEPLELHVIFPPDLARALAQGRVMVCLEGQWRGRRVPLNALPASVPFNLSPQDSALIDHLEAVAGGETPATLMLPQAAVPALLEHLVGHERVTLGKNQTLTVVNEAWTVPVEASLEPSGEILLRRSTRAEASILIAGTDAWVLMGSVVRPVAVPAHCRQVLQGPLRLSRAHVPRFLTVDWPAFVAAGGLKSDFQLEDLEVDTTLPGVRLALSGGLTELQARLDCVYGSEIITPADSIPVDNPWLADPHNVKRYWLRDPDAERAAVARLLRAGFSGPKSQGRYHLAGQNAVLNFFAREFPRLQREWRVSIDAQLEACTTRNLERVEPRVEITSSGVQWFDFNVSYASASGERLSPADLHRLLNSGQSYTRLRNGRFALVDTGAVEELQETLVDCSPQQHPGGYRVPTAHAGFLDVTLRQHNGWTIRAPDAWLDRVAPAHADVSLPGPPLGPLDQVLRPYQQHGIAWLLFLRRNGFGGILADEMGLGKTLQTLAYLLSIRQGTDPTLPALVVCPTSLVHNWVNEVKKFTPRLRVLALEGSDRHSWFDEVPRHDLVVTSYALLRRDTERYRQLEFDTVVLDEAQHIKNRQTQNARVVKAVRARHRLVLTGTPVENSVLDLWSIFDFLMPGYLGSAQDFKERYELPILRDRNPQVQARLARRLRPFVLRRLKREVAPDLPARLEQVVFCELTEAQRTIYRQIMETGRQEMLEAVSAHGLAKSRWIILNALLRLRQVCCDLRLLKLEHVDPATASAKLELFDELLEETLDGGHRVLVFSQFVSMLALIRELLAARNLECCYLDGATTHRADVIERFQSRAEIPVFLISLKAGGYGLNLTAADTVVHFDPWWNPAVEQQATDRAHRIGQTRVVTSYKLIARGTVEEKILTLQNRKREIIQTALGGEQQLAEAATWEEIQELFAE